MMSPTPSLTSAHSFVHWEMWKASRQGSEREWEGELVGLVSGEAPLIQDHIEHMNSVIEYLTWDPRQPRTQDIPFIPWAQLAPNYHQDASIVLVGTPGSSENSCEHLSTFGSSRLITALLRDSALTSPGLSPLVPSSLTLITAAFRSPLWILENHECVFPSRHCLRIPTFSTRSL